MQNISFSRWRWAVVAAVIALGAVGIALAINSPGRQGGVAWRAETPKPVPALSFTDQDGKALSLDDFKGKLVVLDVWATWCGPCRAEFPRLDRLQAALGDKGLAVVAVSVDVGGRKTVDRFYDEVGVKSLAKYLDPASASVKSLGLRGLPTTLILDRQGREIARIEGQAAWDSPETLAKFETMLGNG